VWRFTKSLYFINPIVLAILYVLTIQYKKKNKKKKEGSDVKVETPAAENIQNNQNNQNTTTTTDNKKVK
jgi:hypothetical protein